MLPDWAYYLSGLGLIVVNVAIWAGNVCRLPGNWMLVAFAALYASFFPARPNGLGFGYWSVAFLATLALLGESLAYAARHRQRLARQNQLAGLENTVLGAGSGGLFGALMLLWIPLIGTILALLGAITGAAAGAYLGTLYSRRRYRETASPPQMNHQVTQGLELISRLVVGAVMVLIVTYSSFMG